jgi:hypothetical protein
MSQREFLREFDADAAAAFMDAGLADLATYKPCGIGSTPISDVSVLIDRAVAYQDTTSGIVSYSIQLTAFRSEIGDGNPPKGSTFTVESEVFVVDRIEPTTDESRVVMTVTVRQ